MMVGCLPFGARAPSGAPCLCLNGSEGAVTDTDDMSLEVTLQLPRRLAPQDSPPSSPREATAAAHIMLTDDLDPTKEAPLKGDPPSRHSRGTRGRLRGLRGLKEYFRSALSSARKGPEPGRWKQEMDTQATCHTVPASYDNAVTPAPPQDTCPSEGSPSSPPNSDPLKPRFHEDQSTAAAAAIAPGDTAIGATKPQSAAASSTAALTITADTVTADGAAVAAAAASPRSGAISIEAFSPRDMLLSGGCEGDELSTVGSVASLYGMHFMTSRQSVLMVEEGGVGFADLMKGAARRIGGAGGIAGVVADGIFAAGAAAGAIPGGGSVGGGVGSGVWLGEDERLQSITPELGQGPEQGQGQRPRLVLRPASESGGLPSAPLGLMLGLERGEESTRWDEQAGGNRLAKAATIDSEDGFGSNLSIPFKSYTLSHDGAGPAVASTLGRLQGPQELELQPLQPWPIPEPSAPRRSYDAGAHAEAAFNARPLLQVTAPGGPVISSARFRKSWGKLRTSGSGSRRRISSLSQVPEEDPQVGSATFRNNNDNNNDNNNNNNNNNNSAGPTLQSRPSSASSHVAALMHTQTVTQVDGCCDGSCALSARGSSTHLELLTPRSKPSTATSLPVVVDGRCRSYDGISDCERECGAVAEMEKAATDVKDAEVSGKAWGCEAAAAVAGPAVEHEGPESVHMSPGAFTSKEADAAEDPLAGGPWSDCSSTAAGALAGCGGSVGSVALMASVFGAAAAAGLAEMKSEAEADEKVKAAIASCRSCDGIAATSVGPAELGATARAEADVGGDTAGDEVTHTTADNPATDARANEDVTQEGACAEIAQAPVSSPNGLETDTAAAARSANPPVVRGREPPGTRSGRSGSGSSGFDVLRRSSAATAPPGLFDPPEAVAFTAPPALPGLCSPVCAGSCPEGPSRERDSVALSSALPLNIPPLPTPRPWAGGPGRVGGPAPASGLSFGSTAGFAAITTAGGSTGGEEGTIPRGLAPHVMSPSEVILGKLIGRGCVGRVYRGTWRGAVVAVKVLTHSEVVDGGSPGEQVTKIEQEAALGYCLNHPNIVATYAAFTTISGPAALQPQPLRSSRSSSQTPLQQRPPQPGLQGPGDRVPGGGPAPAVSGCRPTSIGAYQQQRLHQHCHISSPHDARVRHTSSSTNVLVQPSSFPSAPAPQSNRVTFHGLQDASGDGSLPILSPSLGAAAVPRAVPSGSVPALGRFGGAAVASASVLHAGSDGGYRDARGMSVPSVGYSRLGGGCSASSGVGVGCGSSAPFARLCVCRAVSATSASLSANSLPLAAARWETYIVMELCPCGSLRAALDAKRLHDKRGAPKLHEVLPLAWEIACALQYLHANGVVHGDLKAANVMLVEAQPPAGDAASAVTAAAVPDIAASGSTSDIGLGAVVPRRGSTSKCLPTYTAKVADFSHSYQVELALRRLRESCCLAPAGAGGAETELASPSHAAPELFEEGGRPTFQSDVYSLGVVLWELFSGRKPYDKYTIGEVLASKQSVPTEQILTIPSTWLPEYGKLCRQCWGPPHDRPSLDTIVTTLVLLCRTHLPRVPLCYPTAVNAEELAVEGNTLTGLDGLAAAAAADASGAGVFDPPATSLMDLPPLMAAPSSCSTSAHVSCAACDTPACQQGIAALGQLSSSVGYGGSLYWPTAPEPVLGPHTPPHLTDGGGYDERLLHEDLQAALASLPDVMAGLRNTAGPAGAEATSSAHIPIDGWSASYYMYGSDWTSSICCRAEDTAGPTHPAVASDDAAMMPPSFPSSAVATATPVNSAAATATALAATGGMMGSSPRADLDNGGAPLPPGSIPLPPLPPLEAHVAAADAPSRQAAVGRTLRAPLSVAIPSHVDIAVGPAAHLPTVSPVAGSGPPIGTAYPGGSGGNASISTLGRSWHPLSPGEPPQFPGSWWRRSGGGSGGLPWPWPAAAAAPGTPTSPSGCGTAMTRSGRRIASVHEMAAYRLEPLPETESCHLRLPPDNLLAQVLGHFGEVAAGGPSTPRGRSQQLAAPPPSPTLLLPPLQLPQLDDLPALTGSRASGADALLTADAAPLSPTSGWSSAAVSACGPRQAAGCGSLCNTADGDGLLPYGTPAILHEDLHGSVRRPAPWRPSGTAPPLPSLHQHPAGGGACFRPVHAPAAISVTSLTPGDAAAGQVSTAVTETTSERISPNSVCRSRSHSVERLSVALPLTGKSARFPGGAHGTDNGVLCGRAPGRFSSLGSSLALVATPRPSWSFAQPSGHCATPRPKPARASAAAVAAAMGTTGHGPHGPAALRATFNGYPDSDAGPYGGSSVQRQLYGAGLIGLQQPPVHQYHLPGLARGVRTSSGGDGGEGAYDSSQFGVVHRLGRGPAMQIPAIALARVHSAALLSRTVMSAGSTPRRVSNHSRMFTMRELEAAMTSIPRFGDPSVMAYCNAEAQMLY